METVAVTTVRAAKSFSTAGLKSVSIEDSVVVDQEVVLGLSWIDVVKKVC